MASHTSINTSKQKGSKCDTRKTESSTDPKKSGITKIIKDSRRIREGCPEVYILNTVNTNLNPNGLIRRCSFGTKNPSIRNRTIMMLGATGSGKSTLINAMITYILGVEWNDEYRFEIINEDIKKISQTSSQTTAITAYEIYHEQWFKVPYSITIIDTPGYGDTRGIEQDRLICENICELFKSPQGIHYIDAVCFVVQAPLVRLTPTQRYIFDSILSIFGKDIEKNILTLVTFADGKPPAVLKAISESGVPHTKDKKDNPVHFKFNNSALYATSSSDPQASDDSDSDDFDQMYWNMGQKGMCRFFQSLDKLETKNLKLTQQVLDERKQLQICVEGLEPQITAALNKQEELRQTQKVLEEHKGKMEENKDFEYEVNVVVKEKKDTEKYANNCKICEMTCHYPCESAPEWILYWCDSITKFNCTVCPKKCSWRNHYKHKYKYENCTRKEKRTYYETKAKYEIACSETGTAKNVLTKLQDELAETETVLRNLIDESHRCAARLEEIALKPNPMSVIEYIDLLIDREKQEHKEGFLERVQKLEKSKREAEMTKKIAKKEEIAPEEKEKGKGLLSKFFSK
ncbi:uncharacterized protein LOC136768703 [Amia ocellicauda]|uniref:uncharacterized protein LOC136768703 n=1 Tax=Amia ocellicauda TaxID=2972642 RepID=UPI003464E206